MLMICFLGCLLAVIVGWWDMATFLGYCLLYVGGGSVLCYVFGAITREQFLAILFINPRQW